MTGLSCLWLDNKKAERRTEQQTDVTLPSNTLRDGVRLRVVHVSYNHSKNDSKSSSLFAVYLRVEKVWLKWRY